MIFGGEFSFGVIAPWADAVISAGSLVLDAAVVPIVWSGRGGKQHVPYITSLAFMSTLAIIGVAMLSRGLVLAGVATIIGAGLWGLVLGEKALWHEA